jgi:hypothetical protein
MHDNATSLHSKHNVCIYENIIQKMKNTKTAIKEFMNFFD